MSFLSFLDGIDTSKMLNNLAGLAEQLVKLRTLFDAVMNTFVNAIPDDRLEDVMHAGMKAVDALIYAVR